MEHPRLNITSTVLDRLGFSEYWDEHCTWGSRTLSFSNGVEFRIIEQEEMDNIIAINKEGGDPVMYLSGGIPIGQSLQEKINAYWQVLGRKYGFKPLTAEGSERTSLHFLAEPIENK